jgi:predicted O-methyltransferase YrrM
MRLQMKAKGVVRLMGAMSRFLTDRRRMMKVYQYHYEAPALPVVDFRDLCGGAPSRDLKLQLAKDTYGDVGWHELVVTSALVAHYQPCRIFEFGTFMGKSTWHLAVNGRPDAEIFTLDLPPKSFEGIIRTIDFDPKLLRADGRRQEVGHFFQGTEYQKRITQIFEDSKKFDEVPYRASIDFVFVDADHAYPSVVNDSKKALTMLCPGPGKVILWHDCRPHTAVERAVVELGPRGRTFQIKDTAFAVYVSGEEKAP